jgi:hypothetical protein
MVVRLAPVSVPEGISYKLRRAHEQFESLDVAIKRFLEADPEKWRVVSHDDPDTRDRIYGIEVIEPPPAVEWGVLTGEIVHNLRSGLDHLAYALCLDHAPSKTPPRNTEFPIFWDEDRFDDVKTGGGRYKIRGMSWEAQSAIRDLQPFNAGRLPKAQSLWLLQEMSNIDKHRHVHLAVLGYPAITSFEDPEVELIPIWSKDNREAARAHPLTPETEVKSDPLITPQVILDESLPGKDWRPLDIQLRTFLRISQDLSKRFLTD